MNLIPLIKQQAQKLKLLTLTALLALATFAPAKAQDTTRLTISQAEESFLKKNLLLLAAQYNVNKQSALVIQSKAYPNPVFTANFNVYDPENDKYFHVDKTGQKDFALEQLIIIGGKRRIGIEMAKKNKEVAEAELSDLLRNLKYQLHRSFYNIYRYYNNTLKFNNQLVLLDSLISSYEVQANKGNVSFKDVIRLKSVYLKINNERAENIQLLTEENKQMQVLTLSKGVVIPEISKDQFSGFLKEYTLDELETKALEGRPDLLVSQKSTELAELNLKYQKRSVVSDPSFNISTDQRGGAFKNQVNAGIAIPLPLWNHNRGNIYAGKQDVSYFNTLSEYKKLEIKSEVLEAFQNMKRSITEYKKSNQLYTDNFELVYKSVNDNFGKKNISIIEFVDFIESYNEALQELERIKCQLATGAASINYVVSGNLY